jgi:hypothetical protein
MWIVLVYLFLPTALFAQTIRPAQVELSPEEYQRMLTEAKSQAENLEGFIAEMILFKHDADGQLGVQFSRLDDLQADAAALVQKVTALRNDHESWKAEFISKDQAHAQGMTALQQKDVQFASQLATIEGLIKSIQDAVSSVKGRTTMTENANKAQDALIQAHTDKIVDLLTAVKLLSDSVTGTSNTLADYMTNTAKRLSAIEARLQALESVPTE